ncbi:hypothetical protein ABVT39_028275 [Epinephelus coioides]
MAERRHMGYSVQRDILDEGAVDEIAEKSDSKTPLSEKVKKSMRCSGARLKSCLLDSVPVVSWLPRYSIRENALGDLISGISVGIMQLPQGMAYALLASVPPVFGLYSSFYPVLIYFIFGTSKHISIGTYAVMSVMIGGVIERLAPDSNFMIWDNATNSSIVDVINRDAERVRVAAAVTFMSGLFQILLGLVKFGFVVTYLSEPLVRGYTTGAAIHVIVSQLKYTFGISPVRYSGPFALIYTVLEICYLIPQTNIGTLVVSIVAIIGLILTKELNAYLSKKLPVPIPVELLGIVIATVVSWQVNLEDKYGVDVVGLIPSGLQPPVLPTASLFGQVIGDAFALSVVGYGIAISLGRIFALKYGYKVDSNQELIALGLSNSIGGIFQCFAISCSMSRTMVQESTGGRTQVAGALSAIVILFITLWIGTLFEELPKAVLAAIIFVNLHGMMKQFMDIPALWRSNRVDMVVWVATFIFTVLFNPDLGLAAAIGFSMLTVIFRTQLPKYSILGQVPDTDIYRPLEDYNQVKQVPGILIFRSSATLYFANAEMYQEALGEKSGIDITKILAAKKKLEAKRQRLEKKNAKKAAKKNAVHMEGEPEREEQKNIAIIEMDAEPDPSLPRAIVLDLSPVNFLDTVGVKALRSIQRDYGEIGIDVVLAGCQTGVVDNLQTGGFFNDKVTKSCLFSTVHDAVLHCQSARTHSKDKEIIATHFFNPNVADCILLLAGGESRASEAERHTCQETEVEIRESEEKLKLHSRRSCTDLSMPEPGASPRRSPQGVPYSDLQHIVNADGLHLFCRYWEPAGPPRALVLIVHGAGEHSGPYDEIAQRLKELSLLVFAHDHVGHGQSEGERMNIKDFQVYIRDSLQHIDLMKSRHPDLPIFIVGHSMGGAISILTACERPSDFAGVALIAPMVQMNPDSATPFKVFLAKVLNHMLPRLTLGSIDSKWVSRDKKQVEAYDTDELNFHGGMRVSFGMQLMGAAARIEKEIPSISWPFLLLHGDADKLCDIRGSKMMYENAPSSDKKIKIYDGGYHALHHDLPEVAESVLKEVTGWITEHLSAKTSPQPQDS